MTAWEHLQEAEQDLKVDNIYEAVRHLLRAATLIEEAVRPKETDNERSC